MQGIMATFRAPYGIAADGHTMDLFVSDVLDNKVLVPTEVVAESHSSKQQKVIHQSSRKSFFTAKPSGLLGSHFSGLLNKHLDSMS